MIGIGDIIRRIRNAKAKQPDIVIAWSQFGDKWSPDAAVMIETRKLSWWSDTPKITHLIVVGFGCGWKFWPSGKTVYNTEALSAVTQRIRWGLMEDSRVPFDQLKRMAGL